MAACFEEIARPAATGNGRTDPCVHHLKPVQPLLSHFLIRSQRAISFADPTSSRHLGVSRQSAAQPEPWIPILMPLGVQPVGAIQSLLAVTTHQSQGGHLLIFAIRQICGSCLSNSVTYRR